MDNNNSNKTILGVIIAIGVVFFLVVFCIVSVVGKANKKHNQGRDPQNEFGADQDYDYGADKLTDESARAKLNNYIEDVDIYDVEAQKVPVELGNTELKDELPDISTNEIKVQGQGAVNIEIFSTAEKCGSGNDGWINEMAEDFNAQKFQVNGKTMSVTIRTIAAGQGVDYIVSGKYLPQAFTPSNELMGEMIIAQGIPCEMVSESMVRNVAGMVLSQDIYDQVKKEYDDVSVKTVTQATADNKIAMGYTNPFASSTGLNFLLATLSSFDSENILSATAIDGFNKFQANVPFVAYTTLQMRSAVATGSLNGLVMEYQTFVNTDGLAGYQFIPFGVRHDNPLYAIGDLSEDERYAIEQFAEFCKSDKATKRAQECGFNDPTMDAYQSDIDVDLDGTTIASAQKLWKENKDVSKPITAVFVADISGSMDGEPMNQLKSSLVNASSYINSTNSIGLVSYSTDVYVNLPIAPFDLNQRSLFAGAVQSLSPEGSTSTYDAVLVALDMLLQEREKNPNTKQIMFLLSDGEQNTGCSLDEIEDLLKYYGIAVYSIGYNANIDELNRISSINEGTVINADSDDVIYKLKNLFNAQM